MEKLEGWEHATHQLAASDCEPLLLPELLLLADDDCRQRWERLSLGYPDQCIGDELLRQEIAFGLYGGGGLTVQHGTLLAVDSLT